MSLFDKAKETYKKSEEKRATTIVNIEYMGGYQDKNKSRGNLSFYDKQVDFKVALNARTSFVIPAINITDIAIEDKNEVSRRVTISRLLAVGIFTFALQKKHEDKEAFVTIALTDGQEAIFHTKNATPVKLKAKFSQAIMRIRQNTLKQSGTA